DNLGRDQLDLRFEIRPAGLDLGRLWISIAGRPTFVDVRDVAMVPADPDLLAHQPVKQLAGAAHERLALQILVPSRRLTDEHEVDVKITHSEDDVGAPRG